ncbi:MAG: hypothetical protein KatS3mg103_1131 [Phycisphaerales bacterium]|nr:MAG: hypothetical protein KatS3mg103_1131 [Phycisphaerales bacterium]
MQHGFVPSGSPLETPTWRAIDRLAQTSDVPILGVSACDGRLRVVWRNASANLAWPTPGGEPAGDGQRAGGAAGAWDDGAVDRLFDRLGIPIGQREAIVQAVEQGRAGVFEIPDRSGLRLEVLPMPAGGQAQAMVMVFEPGLASLHATLDGCARASGRAEGHEGGGRGSDDSPAQGKAGSMELLGVALDALSAEVALLDEHGTIVAVNRAWREFARLNGYRDDTAGVGTNYLAICDAAEGPAAEQAHAVAQGLRAVLAGRRSAAYVEYPCDSPQEQRWFQVRASGFQWRGRRYAVVSHESLTETKRAELRCREQIEELAHHWRMCSLGELASGLAHELNQPLGAIANYMNGCLRRLEHGSMDRAALVKAMRECADLAEFAAGIIKRMRGFATHARCQYGPIQLGEAIDKAVQFFRASPESHRLTLKVCVQPDLPLVRGDEVQLQQVVLNLLRNAADAVLGSPRSSPGLIELTARSDGEGGVLVGVRDNGPGFDQGVQARLFEPFFSTKSKGMGLGLSLSKTIAEVHGGKLTARNAPEGGAVFELRLPAMVRCDGPGFARTDAGAPATGDGNPPSIPSSIQGGTS